MLQKLEVSRLNYLIGLTFKDSTKFAAIGTNKILYVYSGGVFYDIHPLTNPSEPDKIIADTRNHELNKLISQNAFSKFNCV